MIRILSFIIVLAINTNSVCYANEILSMCSTDSPPYGGPSLPSGGFVEELVKNVATRAGYIPQIEYYSWARCVEEVKKGRIDIIYSMWENIDKHRQDFKFLFNNNSSISAFITLDSSALMSGELEHFEQVSLALHIGGGYDQDISNHKGFHFHYVSSDIQKLKMLLANRVDLIISNPVRIEYLLQNTSHHSKIKLKVLQPIIASHYASPAIPKNHPKIFEIVNRYNQAYIELCNEQFFQKLRIKHNVDFKQRDCPLPLSHAEETG